MVTVPVAVISLIASLCSFTAAPTSDPVEDVPPELTPLKLVASTGAGCPAGAVDIAVSPDNSAFVVRYPAAYEAMVGGGAKPTDARKNCILSVSTTMPPGYTYAIDAVDLTGAAVLPKGTTATVKSNFYSSGAPDNPRSHTVAGPYEGTWSWSYEIDPSDQVWYSCSSSRSVTFNTELRVVGGSATSTSRIRFTPLDESVAIRYHLRWRHCHER